MSHKIIRLVAIFVLGVIVFKVVLNRSSAAPSNTVETLPESAFPAGSGMNQGDVPVTRVIYVTATPRPEPTVEPTVESAVSQSDIEVKPLAIIERSPDVRTAADMQPAFRLVFSRVLNSLDIEPYLSAKPEVELNTHWENGNVLLIRPAVPLEGETEYTFTIAKEIEGIDGSNLARNYSWTYKTEGLVEDESHDVLADGRETVGFSFNYPLDPSSLDWSISPDVSGDLTWSDDNKQLTFTSHSVLMAGTHFTVELGESLQQPNGQPVPEPKNLSFYTDDLAGRKLPSPGTSNNNPNVTIEIPFRRSIDKGRAESGLSISPAPSTAPIINWEGNTMLAEVLLSPDTYYTVEIAEDDLVDFQGRHLSGVAVEWSFRTKKLERLVGFGSGPKLQTLQVGNGANQPVVEYSFFPEQGPMPVTFELYEMALVDWQESPALTDYQLLEDEPILTWGEPAPEYDEERYYYSHQTTMPEEIAPGFYRLEMSVFGVPQDALAVLITDLALAFRIEDSESMLVWVVDLETMSPVTADVTIYQKNTPVLSGQTDGNGFITFSLAGLSIWDEDSPLFTVKADRGDQYTLAAINHNWRTFSLSQSAEQEYLLHLTLDRPVYEPGETINLRAVLRGVESGRPTILSAGQSLTATIKGWDIDYNRIEGETVNLTTGEFGVAYGEISIPEDFPAGGYIAYVKYHDTLKTVSFEVVEPILAEAPIVTVKTVPIVGQGQRFEVVVEATDSQGRPLPEADVQVTLLESVGGSGCYGTNGRNEWYSTDRISERGQTDAAGRYTFSITAEMGYEYHRPYNDTNMEHSISVVLATVSQDDHIGTGYSIVEVASVTESLSWQAFSMVQAAGQSFVVRAGVADLQGLPVAGRSVSVSIHDVDSYDIGYYYEPGTLISRKNAVTDSNGNLAIGMTVGQPGYYELRMVSYDQQGNEIFAYQPLYVTGSGQARNVPSLKLGTGADGYLVGETGQLVVLTNEPGLALLTLANQNGVQSEMISLTEEVSVIDLPITAADAPWLTAEVDLWQRGSGSTSTEYEYYGSAYTQRDGDLVSRSLRIDVIDPDMQLQVSVLELVKTNEAGQTAVTVQVLNGRGEPVATEVALSIVNQVLFSHFPDHNRDQYTSMLLRPDFSQEVYHSLAPQRDLSYQYFGGGCGCGGGWWSDTRLPGVVNNQPSFWNPGLRTDFNGQVTVFLSLPENPDGWHVSASAITADGQVGEYNGQLSD